MTRFVTSKCGVNFCGQERYDYTCIPVAEAVSLLLFLFNGRNGKDTGMVLTSMLITRKDCIWNFLEKNIPRCTQKVKYTSITNLRSM